MRLIGCKFSEVQRVTIDGANQNFGDNFWDTGSVLVNMSYSLSELESGYGRERGGCLSYFVFLVRKYTSVGGKITRFIFILCVIQTSEEDVMVRETPGVVGGTFSDILFLAF